MNEYDIKINLDELDNSINKMDKDLTKLEVEMKNINDAYLFLDESKWNGSDKKNMDNGFGNYLNNMTNFSNNLRDTLNTLKNAYLKYEDLDENINKEIQELEEL